MIDFRKRLSENFSEVKRYLRKNRYSSFLMLLIVLLALPLAVSVASRVVRYLSRAQGEPVNISFEAASSTLSQVTPNTNVKVILDPKTNIISFARVSFTFDKSRVALAGEINTTSNLSRIVEKTTMTDANLYGKATFVVGLPPGTVPPSQVFEIANFPLKLVTSEQNTSASLDFLVSDMQIVEKVSEAALPINAQSITFNLNPYTPTPVPTVITPVPTKVPTSVPTAVPTPIPTTVISPTPIPPVSGSVSLIPVADSYVYSRYPNNNYGTSTKLVSERSPHQVSYLKYNLAEPELSGKTITSAKLRIRVGNRSSGPQYVKLVNDTSWSETGITYGNMPTLGASVGQIGRTYSSTWYEIDITSGVKSKAGQILSIAVDSNTNDGMDFGSRESSYKPTLVIDYLSSSFPTGIPTSFPTPFPTPVSTSVPTGIPTGIPTGVPSSAVDLYPTDDAYVAAGYGSTNYGTETALEVDGSPVKMVYMKFNLTSPSLAGRTVNSAKLYISIYGSSGSTQNVKSTGTSWSEYSITYNNRPSSITTLTNFPGGSNGSVREIDLTNFIKGNLGNVVSILIDSAGSDGLDFYSKENSTGKPYLSIQ